MRCLELGLLAFGPFSDVRLDLGRPGAVQLVYGPNEAGKSTALRAITQVLYGIPVSTRDAHRHAMPDLRIAARLAGENGATLEIVRRKGSKNTLLDAEGNPLADDALAPLLAGVNEAVFRTMFGLDHVSLREGAQALLQGKGAVGESLFAAAIGGPGLHALLEQLEREAGELYKPRGQNPRLNEAMRSFAEAERRSRENARSADAYRAQREALDAARGESATLAERRRALGAEQSRLQRALRVLPLLARREQLRTERDALGDVPALAEDAAARRTRAQAEREEAGREQARLETEMAALAARRAELQSPEALLAIDAAVIDALQRSAGSARAAAGDLPRRRGELGAREEEALSILRDLGRSGGLEGIEEVRVSSAVQAKIRALAQERSGLLASRDHAARACGEARARLAAQREHLAALPPAPDLRALEREMRRARGLGDIDETITAGAHTLRAVEAEVVARRAALPLWHGEERGLRAAPLPGAEAIAAHARRAERLRTARDDLVQRRRELEREAGDVARDIDELRLAGAVPTEDELASQRTRRDELWGDLRAGWRRGASDAEALAPAFAEAVRDADALADRLRREAGRVARLARLNADRAAYAARSEALDREDAALARAELEQREEWEALWSAAGIEPLAPAAMSAWLGRVAELLASAEVYEREASALEAATERRRLQRARLAEAVAALCDDACPPGEDLATAVEWAEEVSHRLGAARARRSALGDGIATLEADAPALERQARETRQRWEIWQREWETSVAGLGLSPEASPEEALAVLDQMARLLVKRDEIAALRHRIDAMEGDARRLADEMAALARAYVPDLLSLPPVEGAERLARAHGRALDEQRTRERIDEDLRARREGAARWAEAARRAEVEIRGLLERAGVARLEELEAVERAAGEVARLERALREVGDALLVAGEGASPADLAEQTRGLDLDAVRARLADIEDELEDLGEELRMHDQRIGSLESGLRGQEEAEGAANAAAEAQEHLATVRAHARRFLRLRLASIVIRREIERYRDENQGTLVARVGELFPRLTLGRYAGVRVGFDAADEPVLRCTTGDGRDVGVEDLSDGTRDQLYLALRVATLEHHARSNPPMPVVLDDVLVHFDDERTRAALAVLGELAAHMQVLLFTHHPRVVELARAALPEEKRVEHVLGETGSELASPGATRAAAAAGVSGR